MIQRSEADYRGATIDCGGWFTRDRIDWVSCRSGFLSAFEGKPFPDKIYFSVQSQEAAEALDGFMREIEKRLGVTEADALGIVQFPNKPLLLQLQVSDWWKQIVRKDYLTILVRLPIGYYARAHKDTCECELCAESRTRHKSNTFSYAYCRCKKCLEKSVLWTPDTTDDFLKGRLFSEVSQKTFYKFLDGYTTLAPNAEFKHHVCTYLMPEMLIK